MMNSPFNIPYHEICDFNLHTLYQGRLLEPSVTKIMEMTNQYKDDVIAYMNRKQTNAKDFDICVYQLINLRYIYDKYAIIDLRHQVLNVTKDYLIDNKLQGHPLSNLGEYRIKKQLKPYFDYFENHQNPTIQKISRQMFNQTVNQKTSGVKLIFDALSPLSMQSLADLYYQLHEGSIYDIQHQLESFEKLKQAYYHSGPYPDFEITKQEYQQNQTMKFMESFVDLQTQIEKQLDIDFENQHDEERTKIVITKTLQYYRPNQRFGPSDMPPIG